MRGMRKLNHALSLVIVVLMSFAASALPENSVRCEFLLSNQEGAEHLHPAFRGILQMLQQTVEADVNEAATDLTWQRVGFEGPLTDPQLSVERDPRVSDLYWLTVRDHQQSKRFAIHTPPLHVWKTLPPSDYVDPRSTLDLRTEDLGNLNVGVLVRSVGSDRIFVSLDEMNPKLVTVSLGLDVPCEKAGLFTGNFMPSIILTDEAGYCRIRVIQASFVPERARR